MFSLRTSVLAAVTNPLRLSLVGAALFVVLALVALPSPTRTGGLDSGQRVAHAKPDPVPAVAAPQNYDLHSKAFPSGKALGFDCDSDVASASADVTPASSATTQIPAQEIPSWRGSELTLTVDNSFPKHPRALAALQAAIDTWTSAASELPAVKIRLAEDEFIEAGDDTSRSEHRLYFAQHGHPRTIGALAVTVTTVDTENAEILDGDIIVNGSYRYPDLDLTDEGESAALSYDLQSVLTHELGHWFGLPEEYCDSDATMYAYTRPGETIKRDLTQSDIIGVQVAYWQADNPSGQISCDIGHAKPRSGMGLPSCALAFALWLRTQRSRANRRTAEKTS